jgi:outer membrane PBP1 activator LpoA protein
MSSFAVLGHRLRPSAQERAFADTLTLPVLLPSIGRTAQVTSDGLVVVVQPLRPPQVTALARTRRLRPLLAGALGLTLLALPAADQIGRAHV